MHDKIDYRYLKAFYHTAKYSNFSKAAAHLSIAQSAVSRQIKLLEESIGEQLILRSSKQVILTSHGKKLLAAIESFEKNLDLLSQTLGPQLIKVGILHGLLENWFPPIIEQFTNTTPHNLQICIHSQEKLKEMLTHGELDLIFTTENIQGELMTSLKLFDEEMLLISKDEIDPKKIFSYPWIVYGEFDPLMIYLRDKGKKENQHDIRIQIIESITVMIQLVKQGTGIAVVPHHIIKSSDKLKTYPFKVKEKTEVFMATHNYLSYPSHMQQLITIIKDSLKK